MEKGFTSQFTPRVTAMPRQWRATWPMAVKSTRRSMGTIMAQMSSATGMLTCATSMLPSRRNGPGSTAPSAMPETMQSATQRVR